MRFSIIIACAALGALLNGCATDAQIDAQVQAIIAECRRMGYPDGSPEQYRCARQLSADMAAQERAGLPATRERSTTDCRPDGLGGMRCTTR